MLQHGNVNSTIIWIILLLLTITTILLLRYIITFKKYVKELGQAYDSVAKGSYGHKIKVSLGGDVGKAGHSFNLMTSQIKKNIEELKDKNSKLNAILRSISNGIMVIDSEENIMLMNKVALDIMGYTEIYEGRPLSMSSKNELLKKTIMDMVYEGEEDPVQLEIDSIWYKIKVDPVRTDENHDIIIGNIINIENITDRVKLEHMRSDFVANVTHELKTPLTSINGFVETLKANEEIDEDHRTKFLDIIQLESDRLKRLIDDILTLSTIENREGYADHSKFFLGDILSECVHLLENTAKAKSVTLLLEQENGEIFMESGMDLLKQLLINLMDNGIKYSHPGGYVKVKTNAAAGRVFIEVEDDGLGIPEAELSRIFERFYRVDKARSKKEGGTGLGLAIVKHIVIRLGGNLQVDSKPGQGTTFRVEIPQKNNN